MERIRKPRVTQDEFVSVSDAMGGESPSEMIERLRAIATARSESLDPFVVDTAMQEEARRHTQERRRAKLIAAGGVDPEAAQAAEISIGRCPRVDGHRGSERAAEAAQSFVSSRTLRTLVLCGPPGRGKSFCAAWIVAESAQPLWIAASEARVGDRWSALRNKAETIKLLIIDDLGRESTDWSGRELADLMELRHNRGLSTVATSNLTKDQILSRYGDRLASRLNDSRLSLMVDVLGSDLRKR